MYIKTPPKTSRTQMKIQSRISQTNSMKCDMCVANVQRCQHYLGRMQGSSKVVGLGGLVLYLMLPGRETMGWVTG